MEDGRVTIKQTWWDMLWLTSCALHGEVPERERFLAMDLEGVCRVAVAQSMTGMTYYAVEPFLKAFPEEELPTGWSEILKKWREAREMTIRKIMLLDAERRIILQFLDKEGCWYMPLKGILIKELYPKLGMRQMSDNDILYDKKYVKKLRAFMEARGYTTVSCGKGNHDEYEKEPVYNYEMHRELFATTSSKEFAKYYADVKSRLIKDGGDGLGYHFTTEDHYVYLMCHEYKHFAGGGTGLRSVVDCYLYNAKYRETMDVSAVDKELKALEIQDFERLFRELAMKVFAKERAQLPVQELEAILTDQELLELASCFDAGTYGTMEKRVENKLQQMQGADGEVSTKTKWKYYRNRLFPPMEHYKEFAPVVYKYKILIPFYCVYRWGKGLIKHGGRLVKEAVLVWKADKK